MGLLKSAFVTVAILNGLVAVDLIHAGNEAEKAGKDPMEAYTDYSYYTKILHGLRSEFPDAESEIVSLSIAPVVPAFWVFDFYIKGNKSEKLAPK